MNNFPNINNFLLILDGNKIYLEYSKFLNNKVKKINFSLNNQNKYIFTLGYKFLKINGEYSIVTIKNKKIIITTDYFLSYPLYYYFEKNYLIISSNLVKLHQIKKPLIQISKKNLFEHYNYGFNFTNYETIYKQIKLFKPNTSYIIDNFEIKKIRKKDNYKSDFKKDLFKDLFELKKKKLNLNHSLLALTAGVDSNILLKKLSSYNFNFDCISAGIANSEDVKIARKNSTFFKKKFSHFSQNYKKKSKIKNLLDEYSKITSGIGTCSEVFLLEMVKKIHKKYNYLLLGGGGEFYRNYFKDYKNFSSNYLTKITTLKKFLKQEYLKECISLRNNKEIIKNDLNKFYINFRYPRNTNRKNNYLKNYIFPINFFVDEQLYKNFITNNNEKENFFKDVKIKKKNKPVEAFNINSFFNLIKPILLENLKENLTNLIFIDSRKTFLKIKNNKLSLKDKWFLLRILNLLLYLKIVSRN